jgi:uncharacterized membrane protein (DUF4010 family)
VAAALIVAHAREPADPGDPGATTVIAGIVCYLLGALVWHGMSGLAVMLAIIVTALLYFKPELSGFSRRLERRDLVSMLQFGVLTFIVLPLLPDRSYGPYGALNPHQIWLMVVLFCAVSLAGYIGLRLFAQRHGAPLLGLLGGLVSSTATTLVYSRHARNDPGLGDVALVVIVLANLVVLLRLALIAAIAAPAALPALLPVLGAGLALGLLAALHGWRRLPAGGELPLPDIKNPTELGAALTFAVLYALVLFLAAWLAQVAGSGGLYAIAIVSGLTDVDAITLSSLRLADLGQIGIPVAVTAIALAIMANTAFKLALVAFVGGRALAARVAVALCAVVVGLAAALLLLPL